MAQNNHSLNMKLCDELLHIIGIMKTQMNVQNDLDTPQRDLDYTSFSDSAQPLKLRIKKRFRTTPYVNMVRNNRLKLAVVSLKKDR